jgi:nitroimidazol reductase NimA-like FMN-containing flavoprotein (pyridoxamine 5'-phosphate oxidase superfamily)
MSKDNLEPTARATVQRVPERGSFDRQLIYSILDEGLVCHVSFTVEGRPFIIPTAYARMDDKVILHGAIKSRMMQQLAGGLELAFCVTLLDGLVLARSAFHHSMNYRSVILFGQAQPITDRAEKERALAVLVEHLVPGRGADARPASQGEVEATEILTLPITEGSSKVRTGPPSDAKRDMDLEVWAGLVPLKLAPQAPETAPDLRCNVPTPDYATDYRRPGELPRPTKTSST